MSESLRRPPGKWGRGLSAYRRFRGYDSFLKDTVKQVISEATILTAALMTAEESYTTMAALTDQYGIQGDDFEVLR